MLLAYSNKRLHSELLSKLWVLEDSRLRAVSESLLAIGCESFNYSFRSNTKPSPYSEKGGGSLASTKQADFECDTQLNDQSV